MKRTYDDDTTCANTVDSNCLTCNSCDGRPISNLSSTSSRTTPTLGGIRTHIRHRATALSSGIQVSRTPSSSTFDESYGIVCGKLCRAAWFSHVVLVRRCALACSEPPPTFVAPSTSCHLFHTHPGPTRRLERTIPTISLSNVEQIPFKQRRDRVVVDVVQARNRRQRRVRLVLGDVYDVRGRVRASRGRRGRLGGPVRRSGSLATRMEPYPDGKGADELSWHRCFACRIERKVLRSWRCERFR